MHFKLLVFLILAFATTTSAWRSCKCLYRRIPNCGIPPSVSGGFWITTGIYLGDTGYLNCNEGFTLSANTTILCQDNATWSEHNGFCQTPPLSGKVYVTIFGKVTENDDRDNNEVRHFQVYVTSIIPSDVNISSPFDSTFRSFTVNGFKQEDFIPAFSLRVNNTKTNKVLLIESSEPINIHTLCFRTSSRQIAMDSFLSFPSDKAGTLYYIMTADMAPSLYIIGLQDATTVNVSMSDGLNFVVQVDQYEVYSYLIASIARGVPNDRSGSKLESDVPFVVISGNSFATIPEFIYGSRDMCAEQMLPVNLWSTVCFVLPYFPRNFYEYRVVAAFDNTTVTITTGTNSTTVLLHEGEHFESYQATGEPTVFQGTKKMNAAVFSVNENVDDNPLGDGSMLQCLNTANYLNKYVFFVPDNFDPIHKIRIIVKAADQSSLRLNGAALSVVFTSTVTIPGGDSYNAIFINVNELTFYTLETLNGATFGCEMYGQIRFGQYSHWCGALLP